MWLKTSLFCWLLSHTAEFHFNKNDHFTVMLISHRYTPDMYTNHITNEGSQKSPEYSKLMT